MFKSLLRTLPSLSGNFTIACKLNEFEKEDNNTYSTYVRYANLLPLQNNIHKKDIELNLLNSKYEYDVKKYYAIYSNVFYRENYSFNKNNYKLLDLDSLYNESSDDRNKDYEFGCKRINYSEVGYQYSFYAPIYIDSKNDIPEYFCINISINDLITKTIKIYINKDNSSNYLKSYISKYLENIDNRVIFCLPDSLQATYFGIDIKNGGLVKYKDNIFGSLYNNQTTINNFDNIICKGFERNNLIMKQIIPFSFMFNLDDLFNDYEREFFTGKKVHITGFYCSKNNLKHNFYDFDINYTNRPYKYKKFNERTGKYELLNNKDQYNNIIDVMNIDYPALNESKYIKYEFTNKITPTYCKFKMMFSSDENPYIINTNFAYSYLQYPNQKYGEFPTTFKNINPKLVYVNDEIKLPLGKNIEEYYNISKYFANKIEVNQVNYNKYKKLMDNYVSSWFTMYDNFDNLFNDSNWSDVQYDYTYYKGILYNLNNIKKLNIDKFGVFLDFKIDVYNDTDLKTNYENAKYVFSKSSSSQININAFNDNLDTSVYNESLNIGYYNDIFNNLFITNTNNNSYLHYNQIMKKDSKGKYVLIDNYENTNAYLKLNDVFEICNSIDNKSLYNEIITLLQINKILGYELIKVKNNINFFTKNYNSNGDETYNLFINDSTFKLNKKEYEEILNKLYISTINSTAKIKLVDNINKINYNEEVYGKICMYYESDFISLNKLINIITNLFYDENITSSFIINNTYDVNYNILLSLINEFKNLNNIDVLLHDEKDYYVSKFNDIFNASYTFNDYYNDNLSNKFELLDNEYNKYFNKRRINIIKQYFTNIISKLNLCKKYNFVHYNNYNGIDISNYFTNIESKEINIYVDSYNIKNLLNEYNDKFNKSLNVSLLTSTEYFVKLLNKDHIYEYFYKLKYNDTISNENIFNLLYVKQRYWKYENNMFKYVDNYTSLYNYILNHKLLYTEDVENTNNETINELINILYNTDYVKMFEWLYDHLSYDRNSNNKFVLTLDTDISIELDLCIKRNVYKLDYTLYELIKNGYYLYLYIQSEEQEKNNDTWSIINYKNNDIRANRQIDCYRTQYENTNNINIGYIEKESNEYLIPLFTNIYINDNDINALKNMISYKKISDKYMYVIEDSKYFKEVDIDQLIINLYESKIYVIEELFNKYCGNRNNSISLEEKLQILYNEYYDELYNTLLHYFNYSINKTNIDIDEVIDVVKNIQQKSNLISLLKSKNLYQIINKYLLNNNKNIEDDNIQLYILEFLKTNYTDIYYELPSLNNIQLYSIDDDMSIKFDNLNIENVNYDKDSKLYTYTKNNVTYGFYYIFVNLNNSNLTFNLLNDYNLKVSFNKINGYDITDHQFVKSIFHILYPFLKVNIFNEFVKNNQILEFQNETEINIKYIKNDIITDDEKYMYQNIKMNANDILYKSLHELKNFKKLKLLRYFNYITPLIQKVDNIDYYWALNFMNINSTYVNNKKYNTIRYIPINIYKYNPLLVGDGKYDEDTYTFENSYHIDQVEYKHFNDNNLYYLPTEIIVYDSHIYKINEISQENINEYFISRKIDILYEFFSKKGLSYEDIKLFLFNKFNSSFFIEKINNKSYKVKYKFSLI